MISPLRAQEVQVQVPRQTEDLHQQEVGLHQVGAYRLRGHEGERSVHPGRRGRAVQAGPWTSLRLVQDSGQSGWSLVCAFLALAKGLSSPSYNHQTTISTSDVEQLVKTPNHGLVLQRQ